MMIRKRKRAHERRGAQYVKLTALRQDVAAEQTFERNVAQYARETGQEFQQVYDSPEWDQGISSQQWRIRRTFALEQARSTAGFSDSMVEQMREARRTKISNKTREGIRERGGEVLPKTLRRRRQGPPAHVLVKMTPKEKLIDRTSRSVSEVGFVAKMKRLKGVKFKNPEAWKVEDGLHLDREKLRELRRMERDIDSENKRRRALADASLEGEHKEEHNK